MFIDKILAKNKDGDFNAIIEIPMNNDPVKYEFDKETGAISVDRFMQVAMSYPCNYGFIPHTLSEDGDPIDVLVITQYPVIPGAVITVRPVGVLIMEDESGMDEKILAVPTSKLDITFDNIKDIDDVSDMIQKRIQHFFENYKTLDKNKWVRILAWGNANEAQKIIAEAISRA